MSHKLILRALRLPLLAALCLCTAVVALTAHGLTTSSSRGDLDPRPSFASDDSPIGFNDAVVPTQTEETIAPFDEDIQAAGNVANQGAFTRQDWDAMRAALSAYLDWSNWRLPEPLSTFTNPVSVDVAADPPLPAEGLPGTHLTNAAVNGYPVAFLLDGQPFKLEPGEGRHFANVPATILFDRGGQFGSATKTLAGGRYEFRLSTGGWDLLAEPQ